MESYLRIGLLVVAGLILFFILFEAWNRRRCLKLMDTSSHSKDFVEHEISDFNATEPLAPITTEPQKKPEVDMTSHVLMISVLARPDSQFSSYELLQSILAAGLQFGEGNLFHYIPAGEDKLFSLAAATKSGEFDLTNIGNLSCKGLILFLDLDTVIDPAKSLEKMHAVATFLADDLDGMLYVDPQTPWSEETLEQYWQKVHELSAQSIA